MEKMHTATLTIDGIEVTVEEGTTLLEAARQANLYIPALCYHPDLPPASELEPSRKVYRGGQLVVGLDSNPKGFEGCQLCVVEVDGTEGFPTACATLVREGMIVHTDTPQVQELRRKNLAKILAKHPHACLVCAEKEGCSREPCSLNVPVDERCCDKFGNCELQKVAEYIGIREDVPRYIFRNFPVVKTPLFVQDYNLCIGCGRCVRVCRDVRGVEALGIVFDGEDYIVGTVAPSLQESDCRFCGACVEVCPTGALMDKNLRWPPPEEDLVPCKHACPAGIDVPRYIRLISKGKFAEAVAVIREKVPLPTVLGYLCHHPCEIVCRRTELNEAISICALKRFAAEHDTNLWKKKLRVTPPTGKKVAIVGAGPAGLTAAYYLAKKGHAVTVFEALLKYGGMLRAGVPPYRLPREMLEKDVDEILALGVEIKTGTAIGKDLTFRDLRTQYDATLLAGGAGRDKGFDIAGTELKGVLWGLDFLKSANLGQEVNIKDHVLVIGGGNVAVDAARTGLRLGATAVTILYRRSREEMPANPCEVQAAENEGVKFRFLAVPKSIVGREGHVAGLECLCTELGQLDETGRRRPISVEGSEFEIGADTIVVAVGETPDRFCWPKEIETTEQNTIVVDPSTLETSLPGLSACGDVVSGPASVIDAIAMARKAAASIDKYLGGDGSLRETFVKAEEADRWLGREEGFADMKRVEMPQLPLERRLQDFSLVELGLNREEAIKEANRCLRCDLRLTISPTRLPPEKWRELIQQNVSVVPETSGVYQLLDEKKAIIYIAGTPDLRQALDEKLKTTGRARYFGYEENPMYTMRESELIQKFLREHGRMPELNEEMFDLF